MYVGKGAVFGSITGGITAWYCFIVFVFLREERKLFSNENQTGNFHKISKALVFQGLAFCITGLDSSILFQFVDSLHLYSLLRETGMGGKGSKRMERGL